MHLQRMCSKRTIVLIALCIGCVAFVLCYASKLIKASHQQDYGNNLVFSHAVSEIDEKFCNIPRFFEKQEVRANEANYLFYSTIPISGLTVHGVYCFEQLESQPSNEKYWMLRGYFPINAAHFINQTHSPAPPAFLVDGNSVKIKIDGIDLYTINSFAAACKAPLLQIGTNAP